MSTATKARTKTGTAIDKAALHLMRAGTHAIGVQQYDLVGRITEIVCPQGTMRFRGERIVLAQGQLYTDAARDGIMLIPSDWPGLPELVATTAEPCRVCAVECEYCIEAVWDTEGNLAARLLKPQGVRTCNFTGCGGRGHVVVPCTDCGGTGGLQVRHFFHRIRSLFSSKCGRCKGTGQEAGPECECCKGTGKMECDVCHGTKLMPGGYMEKMADGQLLATTGRFRVPENRFEVIQCPSCRGYKRELEITQQAIEPYIYAHLRDGDKTYPVLGPIEKIVVRGISPREVRSIKVLDIAPDRDGRLMSLVLEGPHAGAKAWLIGGTYTISTPPRRNSC